MTGVTRQTIAWCVAVAASSTLAAWTPLTGQSAAIEPPISAQFRLVRCGPQLAAACLSTRLLLSPNTIVGSGPEAAPMRWSAQLAGVDMIGPTQSLVSGATQPDITPVFGAPVFPASSLARAALSGIVTLDAPSGAVVRVRAVWRPPLLSLPAFFGIADSASLPEAVREALSAGVEPPGVRSLLAVVLMLAAVLLVAIVPRFLWPDYRESDEDMARQVAAARALLSTQELEQMRANAPREGKARKPEEQTRVSSMYRPPGL